VETVVYRRRAPEESVLYKVVRENLNTFLEHAEARSSGGRGLPKYVREAFRRYLRCGILAYGFVAPDYVQQLPTPARVKITRRHHPLEGQTLEVLRGGQIHIVVRPPDGTPMRVPRAWTDADGAPPQNSVERVSRGRSRVRAPSAGSGSLERSRGGSGRSGSSGRRSSSTGSS
jgi:hypothetical protein